jgi:hypothetical protein
MLRPFCIPAFLAAVFWVITTFVIGAAQAQNFTPPPTSPAPAASSAPAGDSGARQPATAADDISSPRELHGKVGLVRGVLKQLDPIHDQLLVHTFGGGDIRVGFDGRTQLPAGSTLTHLTSVPVGSVISVDTVIDNGKLFARSIRIGAANAAELSGQLIEYNAKKSQLTLRDPDSPENVSLHITSGTKIVNRGQPVSAQALSSGMLIRVSYSASQHTASEVEILAEPHSTFAFEGRIISVDLRSRVVALSNDTDQSLRELAFGSLDAASLGLLHEGANVNIQAEFDGERYNIRTVTPVSPTP